MNKSVRISKVKLNNNHNLRDSLEEIKKQTNSNYKEAYYKELANNISIIVKPNNEMNPNINKPKKYWIRENWYEVEIFWHQVLIGSYYKNTNEFIMDHLLENTNWFNKKIYPNVKDDTSMKDYKVSYEAYFADWNNRPFIVS